MAVEFSVEARSEFDEAFDWYSERSVGAAIGFASEVDAAIEKIKNDPARFPKTYADCQSCSLGRYPYCVIYYPLPGKVVVLAVAHSSRRPAYWRHRR